MTIDNIKNYKNCWIVGNFEPTLFNTNIDIGVLNLEKGHKSDNHYHKLHIEYNIIIKGRMIVDGIVLNADDIFIYRPFEKSKIECIEDVILLVIKNPSTKNDKHYE